MLIEADDICRHYVFKRFIQFCLQYFLYVHDTHKTIARIRDVDIHHHFGIFRRVSKPAYDFAHLSRRRKRESSCLAWG